MQVAAASPTVTLLPLTLSFTHAMEGFAPWERSPHLAVAVSGGADSRALALLAAQWAHERGGTVTALVVDHGLRATSAAEATATCDWLVQHGIAAVVLPLALGTATQASARTARYQAMERWCRSQGVLHLLLGHHAQDQAETLMLRLASGSGLAGLSGMAALRETHGIRYLRPLLGQPKAALTEYLTQLIQPWIEDPSNHAPHFARARARIWLAAQPAAASQLYHLAGRCGRLRCHREQALAEAMARHVRLYPEGVGWCDATDHPLIADMLAALLCTIGNQPHPPRTAELARLLEALPHAPRQTLHGCVIEHHNHALCVYREWQALNPSQPLTEGWQRWDRFTLCATTADQDYELRPLGQEGWNQLPRPWPLPDHLPRRAALALPALWHLASLVAVPHIGWVQPDSPSPITQLAFAPAKPLGSAAFYAMNETH